MAVGPSGRQVRFAVDTGGTFTDLVVEDAEGRFHLYKATTTPDDPAQGVLDVFEIAARDLGTDRRNLLGRGELFIHGTTRATNAILTGMTARTAFLTTRGHPDILLFREGGRTDIFDWSRPYPDPYVPRSLTFEVPERIGADGAIVRPLDEAAAAEIAQKLSERDVEAVAICLLWSTVNPKHERDLAALLDRLLPGVPYTLSHALNPTIREYRRASATAIDASLKPVLTSYLRGLGQRLEEAGLNPQSRLLLVTSSGGLVDADDMAEKPILSIGSGPAMSPVAGREYARAEAAAETTVVTDAGGTSYDVSVVRRGRIPLTRETWLGDPFFGHMTGFPSIDVRSIGAGGGSLARVDSGGLLHVGPQSAGAEPGPACYGRGGTQPTVTDAALVLGYIDPGYFLGGAMRLDLDAAGRALQEHVAGPLSLGLDEAAAAVLRLVTEKMARAIEEITVNQGIDPRMAVLVCGGGAAGLNAVAIARRLGCVQVIIPEPAAALSAAGALMSDLCGEFSLTCLTTTADFDFDAANGSLSELVESCQGFEGGPGADAVETSVELSVEARYVGQTWEISVPLRVTRFGSPPDVEQLRQDFHAAHTELFAVDDPGSEIELVTWHARVSCRLREVSLPHFAPAANRTRESNGSRSAYFAGQGIVDTTVVQAERLAVGETLAGPAIIESPVTTVVLEPGASAKRTVGGSLSILPGSEG